MNSNKLTVSTEHYTTSLYWVRETGSGTSNIVNTDPQAYGSSILQPAGRLFSGEKII